MRRPLLVRAGRDYPVVAWHGGWPAWRLAQLYPEHVEFKDIKRPCFTCSTRGYIVAPVRRPNGETVGYTQEPCPTCDGEGKA